MVIKGLHLQSKARQKIFVFIPTNRSEYLRCVKGIISMFNNDACICNMNKWMSIIIFLQMSSTLTVIKRDWNISNTHIHEEVSRTAQAAKQNICFQRSYSGSKKKKASR